MRFTGSTALPSGTIRLRNSAASTRPYMDQADMPNTRAPNKGSVTCLRTRQVNRNTTGFAAGSPHSAGLLQQKGHPVRATEHGHLPAVDHLLCR